MFPYGVVMFTFSAFYLYLFWTFTPLDFARDPSTDSDAPPTRVLADSSLDPRLLDAYPDVVKTLPIYLYFPPFYRLRERIFFVSLLLLC